MSKTYKNGIMDFSLFLFSLTRHKPPLADNYLNMISLSVALTLAQSEFHIICISKTILTQTQIETPKDLSLH